MDSTLGDYTFGSQALTTDANGFFTVPPTNTQGINTYNFKILDPFGHQYIRSFPVFWTAVRRARLEVPFKPSKKIASAAVGEARADRRGVRLAVGWSRAAAASSGRRPARLTPLPWPSW